MLVNKNMAGYQVFPKKSFKFFILIEKLSLTLSTPNLT